MANRSMDFPGNSHTEKVKKKKEEKDERDLPPAKNVEKVVEGTVTQRKRSWWRRVQDALTGDDAQTVGAYILYDVAIPAFRDLIFDIIRNGAERSLYGEVRPSRGTGRGFGRNNAVNYGSMSRSRDDRGYREERREVSTRARRNHDFGEIIIGDRGEAEHVIDSLVDLVERFGVATVSDLYDLVGATGSYSDEKWGWYNLASARAVRTRDGYLLDLPRTEPID